MKMLRLQPFHKDQGETVLGGHCVSFVNQPANSPSEKTEFSNNVDLEDNRKEFITLRHDGQGNTRWPSDETRLSTAAPRVYNFYTRVTVRSKKLNRVAVDIVKVLVDGGSVINLMPHSIAMKLGFTFMPDSSISIKVANAATQQLTH
jgi:hypothetical protein